MLTRNRIIWLLLSSLLLLSKVTQLTLHIYKYHFKYIYIHIHIYTTLYVYICVLQLCPTLCDLMDGSLSGSSVHGDSPGKNTGVDCHALLQGIFPTQGSNPCLLYLLLWQAASLPLAPSGKPYLRLR